MKAVIALALAVLLVPSLSALENLKPENLVAWCIVPFDANARSPAERAKMLRAIGMTRSAYDWREQHVGEFEEEIRQYRKHGIEFFAFWDEHPEAFRLFEKYDLHPQIWKTLPSPDGDNQAAKVEAAAESMLPLAQKAARLGCRLGLYNHGGWGGEPENLVAVCQKLRDWGQAHVGIVFNWHHAHATIDDWENALARMQPYLLCVNLNGMNADAEPKILALGQGKYDHAMLMTLIDSGYTGPVGILDHRNDQDARKSLEQNLSGLKSLLEEIQPSR